VCHCAWCCVEKKKIYYGEIFSLSFWVKQESLLGREEKRRKPVWERSQKGWAFSFSLYIFVLWSDYFKNIFVYKIIYICAHIHMCNFWGARDWTQGFVWGKHTTTKLHSSP
jgi:hypothetical protein